MIVGADRIGGVSSALAQAAAREGYVLELVGRNAASAVDLVALLENQGADVRYHNADASDEAAMEDIAVEAQARRGAINACVVTACDATGPTGGVGDWDVDRAAVERGWGANFLPAFVISRFVVPRMARQPEGGRILFVSSENAYRMIYGQFPYAVGKHCLEVLAADITARLAGNLVRANVLVLTTIRTETPRRNELRRRYPCIDQAAARFGSPLGRPVTDFQAADNVLLMVDRRSLWMGQVVHLDGGAGAAGGAFSHMMEAETDAPWFEVAYREYMLHGRDR